MSERRAPDRQAKWRDGPTQRVSSTVDCIRDDLLRRVFTPVTDEKIPQAAARLRDRDAAIAARVSGRERRIDSCDGARSANQWMGDAAGDAAKRLLEGRKRNRPTIGSDSRNIDHVVRAVQVVAVGYA